MDLYFDNAATSWPKPPGVVNSLRVYQRRAGASAGRGAYPRAQASRAVLDRCRDSVATLFNAPDPQRVIFTLNCSDALNLALHGFAWKPGDRVLLTPFEHNSVLRPLHRLKEEVGVILDVMPVDVDGRVDVERVPRLLKARTRLIACVHASNVTGVVQPVDALGAFAKKKGIPFLVDAAQSSGAWPLDVQKMNIDLLAFPGHKGLLGPLGTGALIIAPGLDLKTLREGGTGSLSENETQPDFLPDRFEPGSHNAPGLLGLTEGIKFIKKLGGPKAVRRHEKALLDQFREGLSSCKNVDFFGPRSTDHQVAVVSLRCQNESPTKTAARLWAQHRVMVRAGLHCAPWAHRQIGTFPSGTFRFSFGPFVTSRHIDHALSSLREL